MKQLDFVRPTISGPFRTRDESFLSDEAPLDLRKSLTVPTTGSGPTAAQSCRIVETLKHSLGILVWGTIGCRGLFELHHAAGTDRDR